ncbi:hypothetical protein [Nesterenkonia suensis]
MTETHIVQVADETLTDLPVVVSQVRTADGSPRYQRRVHLTLASAQRAVRRAQERGCDATIRLCRLVPVDPEGGAHD